MPNDNKDLLQYLAFNSFINPSFWHKLTQIKLDIDKLNEDSKTIWGSYTNIFTPNISSILDVDSTSFNLNFQSSNNLPAYGVLINRNTIEQFKEENKVDLLNYYGSKLLENIINGAAIKNPGLLVNFLIYSYADLKKYKYYYWFAFPIPFNLKVFTNEKEYPISQEFSDEQILQLYNDYSTLTEISTKQFFFVKKENNKIEILNSQSTIKSEKNDNLKDFDLNSFYFAFADSSTNEYPGWPLRNYLLFLLYNCPVLYGKTIKILSFRLTPAKGGGINCKYSLIFKVCIPKYDETNFMETVFPADTHHWSGWEKNERGKFGPRLTNMSTTMDPKILAENSVDLNLKLMKWRILPNLDLELLQKKRCLLLGAGTLGCSVSRSLLGWGVRNITFVDNGKVSFSNPVRQNLYTHEDCLNGGKYKALAAAENLRKIFPGVNSEGFVISIPMPGHTVGESLLKETKENVEKLIQLIIDHDVIFLLTDSRESRWLPTVLGCFYKKIVMNAALGFDTYLVMRHGIHGDYEGECSSLLKDKIFDVIPGSQLGCYFCNDITAPGNTMKDRTLDQQCTVTRPGISSIAGSLVVELMVSILQHKNGANAKAYLKHDPNTIGDRGDFSCDESLLGIVPHSIRGFLSSFSNVLPATPKYDRCIACSDVILNEYEKCGFDFIIKVLNSAKILEDLTGLSEIHNINDLNEIWEMSDSEDENT